jgi:hypothetical protein
MAKPLKGTEILENLKLLSDWIRVKHPGRCFELVVVGGAAMALQGFKDKTNDVDVIRPEVLPEPIANGAANIARIRRLAPGWLNSNVAYMLSQTKASKALPEYFNEISRCIEVGKNLRICLIGRQALISLKLYAANPSYRTHSDDIRRLGPNAAEITEAVRFVLTMDSTEVRRDELNIVLRDLEFDFDEIQREVEKGNGQGP